VGEPIRYRFEVAAAFVLGVALPLLEVCRRRTDFSDIPGYVDDFIIGALLFFAARSVVRERPYGRALLIAAWGILCGGLWSSFFGQLYNASAHDISGLPNITVVLAKLTVYCVAIVCLVLSIRRSL
jgi:hypothetical protein